MPPIRPILPVQLHRCPDRLRSLMPATGMRPACMSISPVALCFAIRQELTLLPASHLTEPMIRQTGRGPRKGGGDRRERRVFRQGWCIFRRFTSVFDQGRCPTHGSLHLPCTFPACHPHRGRGRPPPRSTVPGRSEKPDPDMDSRSRILLGCACGRKTAS